MTMEFDAYLPVWLRSDRQPSLVEARAEGAPDWPEGAVEKVTFSSEAYPDFPRGNDLPGVVFYGADGWPLNLQETKKSRLDPRFKDLLRRCPLWLIADTSPIWRRAVSDGWESFLTEWCGVRDDAELLRSLPGPLAFGAPFEEDETPE